MCVLTGGAAALTDGLSLRVCSHRSVPERPAGGRGTRTITPLYHPVPPFPTQRMITGSRRLFGRHWNGTTRCGQGGWPPSPATRVSVGLLRAARSSGGAPAAPAGPIGIPPPRSLRADAGCASGAVQPALRAPRSRCELDGLAVRGCRRLRGAPPAQPTQRLLSGTAAANALRGPSPPPPPPPQRSWCPAAAHDPGHLLPLAHRLRHRKSRSLDSNRVPSLGILAADVRGLSLSLNPEPNAEPNTEPKA